MEDKFRIRYKNLKLDKIYDMRCIEKGYSTIKKMEKKGEAIIIYDERKEILERLYGKNE